MPDTSFDPGIAPRVRWDVTLACDRACADCPLGATRWRDPRELSTIEAMLWMNRLRARGCRRLVMAGGDPLRRDDLAELVRHALRLGLEVEVVLPGGVVPPPTRLEGLRWAGLGSVTVRRCGREDRSDEVALGARRAGLEAEVVDGSRAPAAPTFTPTGEPCPVPT